MNSDEWSITDGTGQQRRASGTLIGSYRLESQLGEGGMGTVYRALDTKLNRPVAIKFLSDDLADVAARRRFQREAQLVSSLNHPHILTVHDVGEFEGRQYLVTEYVDGGTLKDWAQREKREWRDVVELLVGVADGLAAAHDAGILHRDIKPTNILITKSGYAKLSDFGLAKLAEQPAREDGSTRTLTDELTRRGAVVGTIAYMSPEQASGKALDARSDVFSFAVVLYQMLTGRRPFEGATDLETLQTIIHGSLRPLGDEIPAGVRALVEKALVKDPAQRYQSMREMVTDLRRLLRQDAETSAERAPASPPHPAQRFKWAAAGALIVLALAVGIGFAVLRSKPAAQLGAAQYTQLTNFDSALDPALSPDGRMLAFVRGVGIGVQSTGDPTEIYVKLLPDGDPVQLTHDGLPYKGRPRFSPDGARIAYSTLETSGFNTYVVPVLGGQEPRRLLTNGMGLNWIDEKDILFSYMTGKGVTMAVATSTESRSNERTVFVQDGYMDHYSYLSPDSKQLLLAEMGPTNLTWEACRVAPFDGSSKGRKVGPEPAQCVSAAWSPDGKWMYFSADTGSGFHIWRQRFPDGKPEQLTSGTTEEEGVYVAPDGRSLLSSIGTFQNKIWVHDSRGDRQVTSESYSLLPTFSADGTKLYYIARTGGGLLAAYGGLWLLDVESGQRQRLLPEFQMWQYSISRDGKRVVFAAPKETGRQGVWLAALDGSSAPRQFTSGFSSSAFFSADGDVFYSTIDKDARDLGSVYRVKEDGSELRKAIPQPVYVLNGVSPDGNNLAVSVPASTMETGSGATELIPLDGGSPTTICICGNRGPDAPQPVSWSPDGKLFYISLVGGQTVYSVPLRPGEVLPPLPPEGIHSAEEAAKLPGAKLLPAPGEFPGPDPSVYAFPKFTSQRNIYRVPVP
ncbi:MAG: protein kinase [Acidobacteriia bacterium]|nr:protein kinase [Terriglobia bacterium]